VSRRASSAAARNPARQAAKSAASAHAGQRGFRQRARQGIRRRRASCRRGAEAVAQPSIDLAFRVGFALLSRVRSRFQPGSRGLRMGTQFFRHRQFAPAGLRQQAAHFVLPVARAGDHGEHLVADLIERDTR
jgi:hypothetical protein